eukprot:TRINITY_DN1958_c0_g1_i2.p1 TRINITY_DN1958_c0_g1~~TRINITY_DN1958_c0_g1_i2.p1  ORF type:complete len:479 (+),score=137.17 TRINITY_DN1958_c0_g1_i2:166-1602(+)
MKVPLFFFVFFTLFISITESRTFDDDIAWAVNTLYGFGVQSDGSFGTKPNLGWKTALAYTANIDFQDWRGKFTDKDTRMDHGLALVRKKIPNNFIWNDWNDDDGWWAVMSLRYYERYGDPFYLQTAINIWNYLNPRWIVPSSKCAAGGMYETQDNTYISSIATNLNIVFSSKLYEITRDTKYLNSAINSVNFIEKWTRGKDCIMDGVDLKSNCGVSTACYTYNTGLYIMGLSFLSAASGNSTYWQKAYTLAGQSLKHQGWFDSQGIMTRDSLNCDDGIAFNGQYVRGFAYMYQSNRQDPNKIILPFLKRQFDSLRSKDRNGDSYGVHWNGPYVKADACSQQAALDAVVAGLIVGGNTDSFQFHIQNKAALSLGVSSNKVVLSPPNSQLWSARRRGNGYYLIVSAAGTCVSSSGSLVACQQDSRDQQWKISPTNDGAWFAFVNAKSGLAMDSKCSHSVGSAVSTSNRSNSDCQKWSFAQ